MKTLSVGHLKGGVGKTTTAVNMAYLASQAGYNTLLVDLDAQAAATYLLRLDSGIGAGGKRIAKAKKSLRDEIFASDHIGLDVLPASLSFRKLPVLLADAGHGQLRSMLKRVGKGYDLLVVDAPAGLSFESEEIADASDLVLVPVIPSSLGVSTFQTYRDFVVKHTGRPIVRAFFSMADMRRAVHRRFVEELAGTPELWPVVIPNSASVERMAGDRAPLALVKRPGKALAPTSELWNLCKETLMKAKAAARA